MPRLVIWDIVFDERNRHATARASEQQIVSVLRGAHQASRNKRSGSAQYLVTGTADDGSRWKVLFNYDPAGQTARPITAIPA